MYKKTQNAEEYAGKTGSHSTRASSTGRNLLGWDKLQKEQLSLVQERETLAISVIRLTGKLKKLPLDSSEYKTLRFELDRLLDRQSVIKKLLRISNEDVGEFIIQIFRERVTRAEWKIIVNEARMRAEINRQIQEQQGEVK